MVEKIKLVNEKFYLDFFFLFLFLVTLPIAKVTAIQNYSFLLFSCLLFVSVNKLDFNNLLKIKTFFIIFSGILTTSCISIFFSIDPNETISETRGEILKPLFVLICVFIFVLKLNTKKIYYLIYILLFCLVFHSIINISMWYEGGFWPFRAGGLLDNGGGERFGIWATYALSISIALMFTKYKKIVIYLFILTLISIIANNTRATFIGLIFILISYFIFFYKVKIIKYISLLFLSLFLCGFIFYSQNFDTRYNVYNMFAKVKYLKDYTPNDYNKLMSEHSLGHSTASRLSMWKTVILYRLNEPFIPLGYGRFLYDKQIESIWKDKPENIPYKLYGQAHNDFISILLSLGVFGLIFFIVFLFYLLKISYFVYKYNLDFKLLGVFIFLGTLGYIASMMFGSFFGDSEQLYFYSLYGIALALYVKTKEEINAKN